MVKNVILLAAYRGESYLPELLDSLDGQTERRFQVLYQDDGSPDGTAALLDARHRKDSRFLPGSEQGMHLGAAGNFLSLLRQADGDRFFFCDQDDIWEKEKLSLLNEAMDRAEANAEKGTPILVHSDCSLIGERGEFLKPSFFRLQGWDPQAVSLRELLVQNNVTGCTMVLNRPLAHLVRTCGSAEKMFMHDWFIAMTAASFGKVVFLNQALTRYRQHGGNVIGASRASLLKRGVNALRLPEKARSRIRLTYSNARAFQEIYGEKLPEEASATVSGYLATEHLPKLSRVLTVRSRGYRMQSPVTRLGQLLFG